MRRRAVALALLAVLSVAVLASAQQPGHSPAPATPQQLADALHGGAVRVTRTSHPGTEVRAGRASTVLDLPIDSVWAVLTDYARYHEFLPHFTQSRVLSKRGATANVYLAAELLSGAATVWAELHIQQATPAGETRVLTSRTTRTNTRRLEARWEATPVDTGARTLVTFEVLVEPDLPFPPGIMSHENEVAAGDSVRNLRQHVAALR